MNDLNNGTEIEITRLECFHCGCKQTRIVDFNNSDDRAVCIKCGQANSQTIEVYKRYDEIRTNGNPKCKWLGMAQTVGELRLLLEPYADSAGFGFRNQPMQELQEVNYNGEVSVVFQENL